MTILQLDTLHKICDSCNSLSNIATHAENYSWFTTITFGDALTILFTAIGLGIAIYQYRKSSLAAREQAQQNQKETWFLNVIVLPQLDKINNFYICLLNNLETDKKDIESWGTQMRHDEYGNAMASIQENRKLEINRFFDHISALVKSYNRTLGKQVENTVMELEDIYVNILEQYGNHIEAKEREQILGNKEKLISILNSGMNSRQNNHKDSAN